MTYHEENHPNEDSTKMAEDIVDAVTEEDQGDALEETERAVERDKEAERIRKAKALRKQLRRRELGLLHYRWPAFILIVAAAFSIMTQFLQVMVHPEELGYDSFIQMFMDGGGIFFLFPVISGALFIVFGIIAYSTPKWTVGAIIPAMMMAMAGGTVYFHVTFLVTVAYELGLTVEIYGTGAPLSMLLSAVLALLAIFMREKE